MPMKPRPKPKGIPIGSYEEIADKAGKVTLKKKPSRKMSVSARIAARKKVRVRRAAK